MIAFNDSVKTLRDILEFNKGILNKGIMIIHSDTSEEFLSYAELYENASVALAHFQSSGAKKGDEVILLMTEIKTFICTFWACVLGGMIPVPLSFASNNEIKIKFFKVWKILINPWVCADADAIEDMLVFAEETNSVDTYKQICMRNLSAPGFSESKLLGKAEDVIPDDIGLIQFSSGSTGDPKGVALTHENLVTNMRAMHAGLECDKDEVFLSWQPTTHDMGLIGFHILPCASGYTHCIMKPALFIRKPYIWLQKASEHKATIVASPNFGYSYFLSRFKPEYAKNWDLSGVRLVINGAEPINASLVEAFTEVMSEYGLKKTAMFNVYGMAEASLAVTFPFTGEGLVSVLLERSSLGFGNRVVLAEHGSESSAIFVDLGIPVADCEIRICNKENTIQDDCFIGEIQIRGKNVTNGYYHDLDATKKAILDDGWLKTGDLGFTRGGRLYVTGREKDVIFIQGQNYYAHDIERVLSDTGLVRNENIVACGVYDIQANREIIVLFIAYKKGMKDFIPLAMKLKRHLVTKMGLVLGDVVPVKIIPKTTSGKVQRYRMAQSYEKGEYAEVLGTVRLEIQQYKMLQGIKGPSSETERILHSICIDILNDELMSVDDNLMDYGTSSVILVRIHDEINKFFPGVCKLSDIFSKPSVSELARFIDNRGKHNTGEIKLPEQLLTAGNEAKDIAVIGMGVRLPMADSADEFWENLKNGIECLRDITSERKSDVDNYLDHTGYNSSELKYLQASYLNNIDQFDHLFFNVSPKEASLMNPLHRITLECAVSAIEDAGYGGSTLAGSNTGVYLGFISDMEGYAYKEIIHKTDPESLPLSITGNLSSMMPSKISYMLDLKGPSMLIDTACSSSLIAVESACNAIRRGDCDMTVAGGIRLSMLPIDKECYKIGIESSDGRTRPFDRDADGTGLGEGCVILVLKALCDAQSDGDNIYAVIKGSASNQDGASAGITAPNPQSQEAVIVKAWENAHVNPEDVTYIELHGTGTKLGDVIEFEGISNAFSRYTLKRQFCAAGSVKSNIGHLYECAGITGMLKAVLALKNREIPASINFQTPNPKTPFSSSPFYYNTRMRKFEGTTPMICGVSSFGLSGTNCHIIMEEYINTHKETAVDPPPLLFPISAKTETSLRALAKKYYGYLEQNASVDIINLCYTACVGRGHYNIRSAIIASGCEDLREKLEKILNASGNEEWYFSSDMMAFQTEADKTQTREHDKLSLLARRYVSGEDVDWHSEFNKYRCMRLALPTYPFERTRCWLDLPTLFDKATLDSLFYKVSWHKHKTEYSVDYKSGALVLFADVCEETQRIVNTLKRYGLEAIIVKQGAAYFEITLDNGSKCFEIGDSQEHYNQVLERLKEMGVKHLVFIPAFVSGSGLPLDEDAFDGSVRRDILGLVRLAKAVTLCDFDMSKLDIVTFQSFQVHEEESNPFGAALAGLGRVIAQEYSDISVRCLDFDREASCSQIIDCLLGESDNFYSSAYRNGERYVEKLEPIHHDVLEKEPSADIQEGGVYVVSGGTGKLGAELLAFLLSLKKRVRIAVISRAVKPIQEPFLESDVNGRLLFFKGDVSCLEEMTDTFARIRAVFGKINGIFHVAGIPGKGLLVNKSEEEFLSAIHAKVKGTWVLDRVSEPDDLDFFLMFSSGVSMIGELGQSDYTCANAFMDQFAYYRGCKGKKTQAINWVIWQGARMLEGNSANIDGLFKTLPVSDALEAMMQVIRSNEKRLLVGKINYKSRHLHHFVDHPPFLIDEKLRSALLFAKRELSPEHREAKADGRPQPDIILKGRREYSQTDRVLARLYRSVLGVEEISVDDNFFDLGGNSIMLQQVYRQLSERFPGRLKVTDLFSYTSIASLSAFLDGKTSDKKSMTGTNRSASNSGDIAIIGVSLRFPGCETLEEYWDNLSNGIDSAKRFSGIRKEDADRYLEYVGEYAREEPHYYDYAYLDDISSFDYKQFKLSPNEASLTDPCQRILMETSLSAIEDAGYGGKTLYGSNTGVYIGFANIIKDAYQKMILDVDRNMIPRSIVGNVSAMMSARIPYLLNFSGPAMVLDTACSSALVAVHTACNALRAGECEMALAGGAKLFLVPVDVDYLKIGIESSDGMTRTFDENSDGAGMGEGVGVVLLKPLDQALDDKDHIYAVIKGSAVNQDGASVGITAPNSKAQTAVIRKAWGLSDINPTDIDYLEAHGTGTKLGDPIEIEGLAEAFGEYTDKKQFCAIGSVKSNIGHLNEGAGIASLIKTVMILNKREIPPTNRFVAPNRKIEFCESPLYVNTKSRKLSRDKKILCAINSFGFSGTNCHMVLEEAPCYITEEYPTIPRLFTVSADDKDALKLQLQRFNSVIHKEIESPSPGFSLDNVCYTAAVGRDHHTVRAAVVAESLCCLADGINKILALGFTIDHDFHRDSADWYGYGIHRRPDAIEFGSAEYAFDLDEKAKVISEKYGDSWDTSKPELLMQLAELYLFGASVPWELLYGDRKYQKLRLPVYLFKKNRCWLTLPELKVANLRTIDWEDQRYFSLKWYPMQIKINRLNQKSPVIILTDEAEFGRMANRLFSNSDIMVVKYSTTLETTDAINGSEESFYQLFSKYKDLENLRIIHLWSLKQNDAKIEDVQQLVESQQRGAYSLFNMTRAIVRAGIRGYVNLYIVSRLVNPVKDGDILNPHNATMYGMGKGIRRENPNIKCKFIDIDNGTSSGEIVEELTSESEEYACAYRNGIRYIEKFVPMVLDEPGEHAMTMRDDGVYIITGGYGGLGLEMAHLLAKSGSRNIALVGRSGLPVRDTWDDIISLGKDRRIAGKLAKLLEIEKSGVNLIYCIADVSDEKSLSALIYELKAKYKNINGIIHGAGIAATKEISNCEFSELQDIFAPKVFGTWLLDKLTKDENMDFFIMFSSIATVFEAIGQAGYIAANSYLDSYSFAGKGKKGIYKTFNWTTWKETGMAFELNFTFDTMFKAITTEQALCGFRTAISSGIGRVVIGEINFDGKIVDKMKHYGLSLADSILHQIDSKRCNTGYPAKASVVLGPEKLVLTGREGRDFSENEKLISEVCQEVLGYEEININENFFEMGADSILIKQICLKLQKYFSGIEVTDIFEHSTISKLAVYLEHNTLSQKEADKIREIADVTKSEEKMDRYLLDMLDALKKDEISMDEALDDIDKLLLVNV